MTCAYVRAIERRREILILAATPNDAYVPRFTNARLTIEIVVLRRMRAVFRIGMRITVPWSDRDNLEFAGMLVLRGRLK